MSEPGTAPAGFIPLSVPEIRGNEWIYVRECLDTGWVSSVGSYVSRFENDLATKVGCGHGVATVNGTAALHIALLVAGIQPDDEVLVSTLTFIAPANAIRYVGAWPVFIDAEPIHWQMDVEKLRTFIEHDCEWRNGNLRNKRTRRRVKAIIPVHILGHPVEMDPLVQLARKWNLLIIEDATESLGSKYNGHMVGSLGDISCFSFNGNKLITCGGGGMLVTNDSAWAQKARYLTTQAKDNPIEYVHNEVGYNYRLTNVLAAMGCAQLERLDEYVAVKREHARYYSMTLSQLDGITVMSEADNAQSTFWLYTVQIDESKFGLTSRQLMEILERQRIQTRPLWQPLHLARPYEQCTRIVSGVSERLYRDGLSLPCSVGLRSADRDRVVDAVQKAMQERAVHKA